MSYSNGRITGNVSIQDVKTALVSSKKDVGGLCLESDKINKWAKWKPLQASALELDTVEKRRTAGWNEFGNANEDKDLKYGVRGYCSVETSVGKLHSQSFLYQAPKGATGEKYRLSDFRCPENGYNNNYGYNKDAYIDLSGVVAWGASDIDNMVILDVDDVDGIGSIQVTITYTPHDYSTNGRWNEMLSIKDFMTTEAQSGITGFDPTECYPCVLINNRLHCLYPDDARATHEATLLTQGTTYWRLNVPSSIFTAGDTATLTILLVHCNSGKAIFNPSSEWSIENWLTLGNDNQAWAAWFFSVPEAVGIPVMFASGAHYGATVANVGAVSIATLTSSSISGRVSFNFTSDYQGSVSVQIGVTMRFVSRDGTIDSTESIGTYTQNFTSVDSIVGGMQSFSKASLDQLLFNGTVTVTATIKTIIGLDEMNGTPGSITQEFS